MRVLLERDTVHLGDRVRMVLEIPTRWGSAGPDLSLLEQDFEVLGSSVGRETEFQGGRMNAITRWLVEMQPKRSGQLTVPVFRVSVWQSRPRTVTVLPPRDAPREPPGPPELILEAELTPAAPYVRAQATLLMRLLHAVDLTRGVMEEPRVDGATVVRLGQDAGGELSRGGRTYRVIERRFALFARRPGALTIPGLAFDGVADDGAVPDTEVGRLFGRGRQVLVRSDPLTVTVREPPPGAAGTAWLPAESVTLRETWSRDPDSLAAGEAVTRTLVVEAVGLGGEQLPDLDLAPVAGAVTYPDRPQAGTRVVGRAVRGRHEQRIALVPDRGGPLELPAVRVAWWDTTADAPREAVLPARTLHVAPAGGRPGAGVPDTAAHAVAAGDPARPWQIASAVLAALWLLTVVAWHRRRPRDTAAAGRADLRRLRADVRLACVSDDPARARDALLGWGLLAFPHAPPPTLAALAERLADRTLAAELMRLDRVLYGDVHGAWSGAALWQAAERGLAAPPRGRPRRASPLPALHPPRAAGAPASPGRRAG